MSSDPTTIAALRAATAAGDTSALLAWADAMQESGDDRTAAMLRQCPSLRDMHVADLDVLREAEIGRLDISWVNMDGRSWWFCVGCEGNEAEGDEGDPWAVMMGQLLRQWNAYFPAVEWLIRECRLPLVQVNHAPVPETANSTVTVNYDLAAPGTHLDPVPDGHEVNYLMFEVPEQPDGA